MLSRRDLLAAAKSSPGAVRWATSGQASLGHIMLAQIEQAAKVQITHIPYKGGSQQMGDALSGQFEILSINAGAAVMQHVKAGKLRPLAVGAPKRLDSLPEVPTLAELGYPRANLSSQFGVFAPARTPPFAAGHVVLAFAGSRVLALRRPPAPAPAGPRP